MPNGPSDIATLSVSNQTDVSLSADTEVESVIFQSGASAFTITSSSDGPLTVSGAGVENDSGVTQTFIQLGLPGLTFTNTASAGTATEFMQMAGTFSDPGTIQFLDNSSAGQALFVNQGQTGSGVGIMRFFDNSTAGDATVINEGANDTDDAAIGGFVAFEDQSNAGNATFENFGSNIGNTFGGGGTVDFDGDASAGNAVFINHGAGSARNGGLTEFFSQSTADHATIICEAGLESGSFKAGVVFDEDSTAANATITIEGANFVNPFGGNGFAFFAGDSTAGNANFSVAGGTNGGSGGEVQFADQASGGTAQYTLSGNASISFALSDRPELTMGSLNGAGVVSMGSKTLTIGATNLDSTFGGVIEDGRFGTNAKLVKEGTGTLTLTDANPYTGGTTINAGVLLANSTTGSTTGTGAVQVNAGTLGGSGIISGAVTVGTNTNAASFLAPSKGAKKPATLAIQSALTLNHDSTYLYKLDTKHKVSDQVLAQGVTIDDGAKFSLRASGRTQLPLGQVFTVISNTAASAIAGTFHNLPEGKTIIVNGSKLQASYTGGDGNDLTLTIIP